MILLLLLLLVKTYIKTSLLLLLYRKLFVWLPWWRDSGLQIRVTLEPLVLHWEPQEDLLPPAPPLFPWLPHQCLPTAPWLAKITPRPRGRRHQLQHGAMERCWHPSSVSGETREEYNAGYIKRNIVRNRAAPYWNLLVEQSSIVLRSLIAILHFHLCNML